MRKRAIYGLFLTICTTLAIGCAVEPAPSEPPASEAAQAVATGGGCSAYSPCTWPYNGVAVSCSAGAGASCSGFSDHVTCGGVSTYCQTCTNTCDPITQCCKQVNGCWAPSNQCA